MWGCGSSELEGRAEPRGESSGVRDNREHEKRQSQDGSRKNRDLRRPGSGEKRRRDDLVRAVRQWDTQCGYPQHRRGSFPRPVLAATRSAANTSTGGVRSDVRCWKQHARTQSERAVRQRDAHTCARRGLDVRAVPDESGAAVEANARSSLTDSVRCRGDHGDHDAGCCICCQNTAAPLGCMLLGRGRRTVPLRSLHGSTSPIKLEGEVAPGRASVSLAFGSSTHKRAWHRPFRTSFLVSWDWETVWPFVLPSSCPGTTVTKAVSPSRR